MSLAPASSRGAFLKARLAVNGIQCAARSFGTLTVDEFGLLSSMGASCVLGVFWGGLGPAGYQLHRWTEPPEPLYFRSVGRICGHSSPARIHKSAAAIQNTSPS